MLTPHLWCVSPNAVYEFSEFSRPVSDLEVPYICLEDDLEIKEPLAALTTTASVLELQDVPAATMDKLLQLCKFGPTAAAAIERAMEEGTLVDPEVREYVTERDVAFPP